VSGDFERWNNSPSESKAPKPIKTLYSEDKKYASRVVILVDIGLCVLIVVGIIWYVFYR
jgi:hypothetical protein